MIILEELFSTVAEFRKYSPYLESNVSFQDLNSSALSAKKQISIILSKEVYDEVVGKAGEPKEALCSAMANLTLAKQMIFDIISRRKNEIDIYKHEQEAMRRAYTDNYFNAMDTLIQLLSDGKDVSKKWKETRYCKMLSALHIKTADEFDSLYPIDMSYLFFFRTIPLQKEALDDGMNSYFERATKNEEAISMLQRCLAKQTVAIALRRFDIIEFPPTIRSLFDDTTASRSGKDEQNRMLDLAASLTDEVKNSLTDIDLILSSGSGSSVDTETSFNRPEDKIYLMA